MTLTPGARLGPYDIVDLLGEGGMGEVFVMARPVGVRAAITRFDVITGWFAELKAKAGK